MSQHTQHVIKNGGGLRWLKLLMFVTILGVAGFQLYWLKESYDREKKTLDIKADVAFHETVERLQVSKLRLDIPGDSSHHGDVKIFISDGRDGENTMRVRGMAKDKVMSTINIISSQLRDSLKEKAIKNGMIVSMNKSDVIYRHDSGRNHIPPERSREMVQFLYGVDSLQDSVKLVEIDHTYARAIKEENIDVPFSVKRLDSSQAAFEPVVNEVTVGFAHPITYQLNLGNTFPYLLKRVGLPILFSVFLLGITIFSFVLLYRSLLRQRRLAELKNEFISNITHELKTPIATVGVAIEALRNFNAMNDPQRTKEYLDISSNELHRLGLLVDKVLKLSMFEKKEIDLKLEPVNLVDVVEEVTSSMKLQLEKYHAKLDVKTTGDVNIRGDKLHLTSVVFNLLDNALKYSKPEPIIEIELNGGEKDVTFSIEDNGIGIAAEYREKIFEKFFRVPHGDTHNAKGYGLGLSYVAQVVQKHDGKIVVESEPGVETKFIMTLPRV